MSLEIEHRPDCTIVSLSGQLTGSLTSVISEQILSQIPPHNPRLILDLSGVTYLSSAALRLLLTMYRVIDQRAGTMVLAGMREEVWDILNITGFGELFPTYQDRTEAMARLR